MPECLSGQHLFDKNGAICSQPVHSPVHKVFTARRPPKSGPRPTGRRASGRSGKRANREAGGRTAGKGHGKQARTDEPSQARPRRDAWLTRASMAKASKHKHKARYGKRKMGHCRNKQG